MHRVGSFALLARISSIRLPGSSLALPASVSFNTCLLESFCTVAEVPQFLVPCLRFYAE